MSDRSSDRRDARRIETPSTGRPAVDLAALVGGVARVGPPVGVLAALLVGWHGTVVAFDVPSIVLPTPIEVGRAIVDLSPTLLGDAYVTALTAGIGLFGGGLVGVALAFAMTYSRTAMRTVLPYVVALRIAPMIAIAPLLFLWFGRGIPARALLVATLTVFPITIATVDGLRDTPDRYLDLMQSVGASETRTFFHVRVPAAAPSVLAGFKIAATLSVIGAVVAEFVTLNAGLGYRVFHTAAYLRTAETYAALAVLSTLGIAFYLVPVAIGRLLWTS